MKSLNERLNEEVEILAKDPRRRNLNVETFDALDPFECFMGQMFSPFFADTHRETIGPANYPPYRNTVLTPLEVWAAITWETDKQKVLDVVKYIKGEGVKPHIFFPKAL